MSRLFSRSMTTFILSAMLVGLLSFSSRVSAFEGTGTGTSADPYIVSDCLDLQSIKVDADNGLTADKYYNLAGNIDCTMSSTWNTGLGFDPINQFMGVFDGQGFTIDGLFIDRPLTDQVGLFSYTAGDSVIANLKMTNVDVTGQSYVGAVVGFSYGNILGLEVSGAVTGASEGAAQGVGGIAGRQQEYGPNIALSNLKFSGTVNNTGPETGGIVGTVGNGTVSNSYVDAVVTGTDSVGGLVGLVGSCCNSVTNSYATGSVVGNDKVGGAIGIVSDMNETDVENLFAAAGVTGTTNVGGVIGIVGSGYGLDISITGLYFDETAAGTSDCYASAAVTATCTAVNSDGLDGDYFYDSINQPLASWDFTNTWGESVGDYPVLQPIDELATPSAVNITAVSYPSNPLAPEVTYTVPTDPGTFAVSEYRGEIKLASSTWGDVVTTSDTGSDSGNTTSMIFSALEFGTEYTVRIRAISPYGAGPWDEYTFTTDQQQQVEISSCTELQAVDQAVENIYAAITLTGHIDCSGIEDFDQLEWDGGFSGTLDGQGFTISNLNMEIVDSSYVGLFSEIYNATIIDINFESPTITGTEDSYYCGVVAGYMNNTNVYNVVITDASVTCRDYVGGIAGRFESEDLNTSEVEAASVSGVIHGVGFEVDYGGGPQIEGGSNIGGLFGRFEATYDGNAAIRQSFTDVAVLADGYRAGGLVGSALAEHDDDSDNPTTILIQDSYSAGDVTSSEYAGGIIGGMESYNDGYEATVEVEIENSYSSASVTASVSAGGIVGYMDDPNDEGEQYILSNVFATGQVTADVLGYGLIGSEDGLGDGLLAIDNSFFDQTATGQTEATAYPEIEGWTAVNTDGSATDYFKNNSSNAPFTVDSSAIWDFDEVWGTTSEYPCLSWSEVCSGSEEVYTDYNDDSVDDRTQSSLSSYISPITGKRVVIDVGEDCDITTDDFTEESNLEVADPAYQYQHGLFDFAGDCNLDNSTTTIKLFYYGVSTTDFDVRKFDPKTNAYSTIDSATKELRSLYGQSVLVVSYEITDGGSLDMDGEVNGEFVDPAGIGTQVVDSPNTGLMKL